MIHYIFFQISEIIQTFPAFSSFFVNLLRVFIDSDNFQWNKLLDVRTWTLENFVGLQKFFLDFVAILLSVCDLLLV
jgi:hypothetical protein